MCFASAAGRAASTAVSTIGSEGHWRQFDPQLAGDDARHVEDVFDQLGLRAGVALDDFERVRHLRAGSTCPCRSIVVHPRMAFSGVRSSCDRVARNSSFSRLAASASARAALQREQRVPHLVLPQARAQRGAHDAHHSRDADRALDDGHVAKRFDHLERPDRGPSAASRRQRG